MVELMVKAVASVQPPRRSTVCSNPTRGYYLCDPHHIRPLIVFTKSFILDNAEIANIG